MASVVGAGVRLAGGTDRSNAAWRPHATIIAVSERESKLDRRSLCPDTPLQVIENSVATRLDGIPTGRRPQTRNGRATRVGAGLLTVQRGRPY